MKSVIKTLLIASFCLHSVSCNNKDVNSLKEQNDKLQKQMDELIASQETKGEEAFIKAPAEGEAFITLRSDEVRPLADVEIIFFRSDFAKDFETFRDNLIATTKDEQKSKLTQAMSDTQKDLERLEKLMTSIAETTRESEKKFLQEKRVSISKEIINFEEKLKESDPLVESLNKYFSSYTQLETSLVEAANVTRDKAHKLGVDLIMKVNKAIVSERIARPKYKENHQKPKPIVTLSLSQKFNLTSRYSFKRKIGLYRNLQFSDVPLYLSDTTLSAGYDDTHFFVKNTTSNYGQILGVCSRFFPATLNNSKIASEMRKALLLIYNYKKEIKSIKDKLKKNIDTIDEKFLVYANSNGTSTDSITERLLERESIEGKISSLNEELNKLKDDSEETVKAINLAIHKAKLALEEKIKDARKALVMGKEMLSAFSGSEFQKILSEPEKITMQEKIKKFLDSNKLRSVRTGSDGKFSVPPKARYASSFVTREGRFNEYFWLIKVDLEDTSVKISNSNLTRVGRNGALLGALDCELE